MEQDLEVLGIAGGEKIGSSASEATLIKDGATDLSTINVVIGVSIEWGDSGFEQASLQRYLPWCKFRPVDKSLLNPVIRLVHQLIVPASILHITAESAYKHQ